MAIEEEPGRLERSFDDEKEAGARVLSLSRRTGAVEYDDEAAHPPPDEATQEVGAEPSGGAELSRPTYTYEAGRGLPLDELRDGMGDKNVVNQVVTSGSGAEVSCKIDLRLGDYAKDEEPEGVIITINDVANGTDYHLRMFAGAADQAAVFDVASQTPEGERHPDLYARQFVEWSLDTCEHEGVEIRHVDTEWVDGSVNYAQFQERLEDDEANLLEAIDATWSGTTFPELGFTEVEYINIDPPDEYGEQGVYVRFSKPDPESRSRQDFDAEMWDVTIDLAQERERLGVEDYIERCATQNLEVGTPVAVPTADGPVVYTKAMSWITNRDEHRYSTGVFGDQFEAAEVLPSPFYVLSEEAYQARLREDQSEVAAGGIEEAFAAGKVVLDVGSGQAIGLLQYAEKYRDTTFIGLDSGYGEQKVFEAPAELGPGVHLSQDDWHTLAGLPNKSVDTIIAMYGPFLYGRLPECVDAITRVANDNAVLRISLEELGNIRRAEVEEALKRRQWRIIDNSYVLVAVKEVA